MFDKRENKRKEKQSEREIWCLTLIAMEEGGKGLETRLEEELRGEGSERGPPPLHRSCRWARANASPLASLRWGIWLRLDRRGSIGLVGVVDGSSQ